MNKEYSASGSAVTSGASTAEAHSPLPYSVDHGPNVTLLDANSQPVADFWMTSCDDETAEFVRRACNNHGPLLAALEKVVQARKESEGPVEFGYMIGDMIVEFEQIITAAKEQQ